MLEKLLKSSGLIDKKDDPIKGNYILQTGFRNLDTGSSIKITPDAVIYLADGDKNIIVDSKASIVNYLEYINAEDKDEASIFSKKFYQDTLDRIKEFRK